MGSRREARHAGTDPNHAISGRVNAVVSHPQRKERVEDGAPAVVEGLTRRTFGAGGPPKECGVFLSPLRGFCIFICAFSQDFTRRWRAPS
jgi:hypothetical protein